MQVPVMKILHEFYDMLLCLYRDYYQRQKLSKVTDNYSTFILKSALILFSCITSQYGTDLIGKNNARECNKI